MKPATFEETLTHYERLIKSLMKKLHLYQNHEEYYQLGLIALWKAYENYDASIGNAFSSYAYQTIYYDLLNHLKKESHHQAHTTYLDTTITEIIPDKENNTLDNFHFSQYIKKLSPTEQLILTEKFQHDLTFKQIAQKHNMHLEKVKSAYRYSLKKLKKTI